MTSPATGTDPGSEPVRRGVVALGDSITVGEGEPLRGVMMQSWAQWVAEAFDLPLHKLARNGATTREVLDDLAPRMRGRYDVALVYAGVNDVRSEPWDAEQYRRTLDAVLAAAARHAERVLVATLPNDLGRPSSGAKAAVASEVVRDVAKARGAVVLDLAGFGGRRFVLPDIVHPTALGQVEIAARAVAVLTAAGARGPGPTLDPWTLADPYRSLRSRIAAERRWLRGYVRDLRRRAIERLRSPSPPLSPR
jgi:lysophospholipase L1-like esterase